jgi:hypothetical protein
MQIRFSFVCIALSVSLMSGTFSAVADVSSPKKSNGTGECQTLQESDGTKTKVCYYRSKPIQSRRTAKSGTHASVNECQKFRDLDGTMTKVCYYRSGQGTTKVNLLNGNN